MKLLQIKSKEGQMDFCFVLQHSLFVTSWTFAKWEHFVFGSYIPNLTIKKIPGKTFISFLFFSKVLLDQFKTRDLIAISASDLLIEPTHFPEQKGYYSDADNTEFTDVRPREDYAGLKVENDHATSKSTRTDL